MTSLAKPAPRPEARIARIAATLAGVPDAEIVAVPGGGNNRVYRVEAGGETYALKSYPRDGDPRDRLGTEFEALGFLEAEGVRTVPRALAADRKNGFALYQWIEGVPVTDPGAEHMDAALALMETLALLAKQPAGRGVPPASEACLCGDHITSQISARLDRLSSVATDGSPLRTFLDGEFTPVFRRLSDQARRGCIDKGVDFETPIPWRHQTLSPSDFGFHNALEGDDGTVIFLDLEYFGRDDPVKLVSDFLLHPGMNLGAEAKRRFRAGGCRIFAGDARFEARLALYYPLYGLRWCMILLNEFLPAGWARRRRARGGDAETARAVQLEKARARLVDVGGGDEVFCHVQ